MATEHKNIIEANLHEPKGISAAATGQAYIADGAGSGNFSTIVTPAGAAAGHAYISDGAGGGSFKKIARMGYWNYNDLATTTTPIVMTSAGVFFKLTNDEAGAQTQKTFKLPEVADVWNKTTNQMDFSGLTVGDVVTIRFDLSVTTTGANHAIRVNLDFGIGATPFSISVTDSEFRSSGLHNIVRSINVFIGDTNIKDNPGEFTISSDTGTTDSVIVNGWFLEAISRGAD